MNVEVITVPPERVTALARHVTDDGGRLRLLPAAEWRSFEHDAVRVFCGQRAIYGVPTVELVDWLKPWCEGKRCVEIGSGNAGLHRHLGIRGTDSFMQTDPAMVAYMTLLGQQPTAPPADVECIDAETIVRKMKPDVVIGSWITDRFDPTQPMKGGNMFGPREEYIIERCGLYIHIGNESVHARKNALRLPHTTFQYPWLVSRGKDQSRNVIYVWKSRG